MGFSKDFVWGAATAAYQIEGAAFEDGKGLSIWDVHSHDFRVDENGKQNIMDGDTGDVACDFYHRYKEDIALMKQAGIKAFRFSVSWPRVLPDGIGRINEAGLDFYSSLVDELLAAGIEPYVTLFHWDYPQKLQQLGGWLNPESSEWFAQYTRVIVEKLSDRVRYWMTLNEPQCHIIIGHMQGECAPKLKLSYPQLFSAMHNHLLAHGKAVRAIRKYAKREPKIGTAFCTSEAIPATDSPADVEAARKAAFDAGGKNLWAGSWWFDPVILGKYPEDGVKSFGDDFPRKLLCKEDMEIISQPLDFLGVNVYRGGMIKSDGKGGYTRVKMKTGYARTAFKWPVTPETLYYTPKFLYERYHLPILITENGLSSMDWPSLNGKVHDMQRIDFMHRYLKCLRTAVDDGVEVLGYFTWSFMDNMEWSNGYSERFGIIYVDFETQERILKDSAYWYHDTILQNGENL